MLDRARTKPTLLPSIFLAWACVLCSPLGCKTDDRPDPAVAKLEAARAQLETELADVRAQLEQTRAQLETEAGCRKQVIGSLSFYGGPDGPQASVAASVAARAQQLLEQRLAARKPDEKLAIVLDVDETTLDNFEQLSGSQFCFVRSDWDAWVESGTPGVVAGMKPLYDYAREHDVAVVFITGRREHQRAATTRALEAAGFEGWHELILRSEDETEMTAAEYKSGRRAKLEDQGYAIVLSVGDQASDLAGGHTEQAVLMPNPFYHVD